MTLKRERGCVPAFLFYMEGSEIMARVKIEVPDDIKVQLSQMSNVKVSWDEMRKEALLFLSSITSLDKEYANFTAAQLKNIVANPEIASYVNQMQGKKEK